MTSKRIALIITAGLAALTLVVGAVAASPATADSAMSPLELAQVTKANCQVLLAHATGSGQRSRARACIADQTVIITALAATSPTPSPSVSVSPSASPSATVSPSASPSPTTTPTPGPFTNPSLRNCAANPGACGYPTTATTGVPVGTALTTYVGQLTIHTAGTWEGLDVQGCIDVRAANVVIKNSRVTCQGGTGILLDETTPGGSVRIERVEVSCVDNHGSGIWAHHATMVAVYVHHCENGLEINEGSSVVDSVLRAAEANADGHGDGIQSQDGDHVTIRHNTLLQVNPVTSAIITNPTKNNHWRIEDNLMGGGAYTLYCPENGTDFVVRGNRFAAVGSSPYGAAYGLTDACGQPGVAWGGPANYLDATGATVSSG